MQGSLGTCATDARRAAAGLVLAAAVAILAGCSPSSGPSAQATTTTAPTTSTVPAAPTTTYPVPPPVPISIPRSTDTSSPDGSGCEPPAGTGLPDGLWYGELTSADAATNTIGLDLACWFSGAAAQNATGSSVVPNGSYVRNVNPTVYQLRTVPDVAVLSLANGSAQYNPATKGVASAEAIVTAPQHGVWVQITHGFVVVIQAQYLP
jgi:hypothetical protein